MAEFVINMRSKVMRFEVLNEEKCLRLNEALID